MHGALLLDYRYSTCDTVTLTCRIYSPSRRYRSRYLHRKQSDLNCAYRTSFIGHVKTDRGGGGFAAEQNEHAGKICQA